MQKAPGPYLAHVQRGHSFARRNPIPVGLDQNLMQHLISHCSQSNALLQTYKAIHHRQSLFPPSAVSFSATGHGGSISSSTTDGSIQPLICLIPPSRLSKSVDSAGHSLTESRQGQFQVLGGLGQTRTCPYILLRLASPSTCTTCTPFPQWHWPVCGARIASVAATRSTITTHYSHVLP